MAASSEEVVNRVAQGLLSTEEAVRWFAALTTGEQARALEGIRAPVYQCHPLPDEAEAAIARAGLKPTHTPCVLLRRYPVSGANEALTRILALPKDEYLKSFRLLLALFSIADQRRRETECRGGCTHHWHNLSPHWKLY